MYFFLQWLFFFWCTVTAHATSCAVIYVDVRSTSQESLFTLYTQQRTKQVIMVTSTKTLLEDFSRTSRQPVQAHKGQILPDLLIFIVSVCKGTLRLFCLSGMVKLKTLVIGLTQAERSQIHTHLPRRSPCLYSTDGQSMGPETAPLLMATSLHSKKILCVVVSPFTPNITLFS